MAKGRFAPLMLILLWLVANGGHADITPQQYWKTVLPNTPIPSPILQILNLGVTKPSTGAVYSKNITPLITRNYRCYESYSNLGSESDMPVDPNSDIFFLRSDLHPGRKMTLEFRKPVYGVPFLPRRAADSIPFSSAKAADILSRFKLQHGSAMAKAVETTLHDCQAFIPIKGEHRLCVTSLESMVDFAVEKLGTHNLAAASLNVEETSPKKYTVTAVKEMLSSKDGVLACHMTSYPYAVFLCHTLPETTAFEAQLTSDGSAEPLSAVAVCHSDTASWNPQHVAFKVLKLHPGDGPICHFFLGGSVVWTVASN